VRIDEITGDDGRLPREVHRNTAGVAAGALLARLFPRKEAPGVALSIRKGLPLASGLGGSAASAAAAVVAVGELCGGASAETLIACALEGERLGSGSAHPDNVVPAVCGGFVLVRETAPLDIVRLPVPAGLTAVVVHPPMEIETSRARELLGDAMPLADVIRQSANLGSLVDALHRSDLDLLSRSLVDRIAEPRRSALVPWLEAAKAAAREAGALGAGLSGSGPSLFAICRDRRTAEAAAAAIQETLARHAGGRGDSFISAVGASGARVLSSCGS
jgi:homoserine kinase